MASLARLRLVAVEVTGAYEISPWFYAVRPRSAAVWLDGCARLGTGAGSGLALLGVEVRLLQDNVTNNAVLLEGCAAPNGTGGGSGFEIGWSTFVQEGSCWFPSNGKRGEGDHSFGGNHKSVLTTVGASGGWVHHNHVLWNCGGWGSFVSSDRTVLELSLIHI